MKLNNKILLSNIILSLLIFSITAVGVYYIVNSTLYKELDNHLLQHKVDILNQIEGQNRSGIDELQQLGNLGSYEWMEITSYDGSVRLNENKFATIDTTRNLHDQVETKSYRRLLSAIRVGGRPYTLKLYEEVASWEQISRTISVSVLAALFIWIILLYLLNQIVLDKILTPFYDTVSTLEGISNPSHLDESFPETSTYEVNVLNRALNSMMQHIRTSFEDQKHFIQNASHELLTPLSIIRQKTEKILADSESLDIQTLKSVSNIHDTSVRLSRLSNALLLISRVENKQYTLNEQIDIEVAVNTTIEELRDFLELKKISVKKEFECPITVQGNSELIQSALYNILQNAIKFTPVDSTITVVMSCDDDCPRITIGDEGPGIPPEYIDTVFDRFKKTKNRPEGVEDNSSGLGLSIVQSICRLHEFKCTASNRPGNGVEISIIF